MSFVDRSPEPHSYLGDDVLYIGKPVVNWFLKELSTTHMHYTASHPFTLNARFENPVPFSIRGTEFRVSAAWMTARRVMQKKRRFMPMTGEALVNWETRTLAIAAEAKISVHGFNPNLPDWEDFDGGIPQTGTYQFVIDRYFACLDLETAEVPDITGLCCVETPGSGNAGGRL